MGACLWPSQHRRPVDFTHSSTPPLSFTLPQDTGSALSLYTKHSTTYEMLIVFQSSKGKQAGLIFMTFKASISNVLLLEHTPIVKTTQAIFSFFSVYLTLGTGMN